MSHTHHHHGHNHNHTFHGGSLHTAFILGILLNVFYIIIEFGFGLYFNSMALIADAGHNTSDVLGLLLAWGAAYLAKLPVNGRHTYGYRKATVLAALINAVVLYMAIGAITYEAVQRLLSPHPVPGQGIIWVAAAGFVVNALTAWLFFKGKENDINRKGAFLHMAADAAVSLGVVFTGILLLFTDAAWIDPAVGLIIVVVIAVGTWSLLREALRLTLDSVPENISYPDVKEYLESIPGVKEAHDLHIWALSSSETALTVHLVLDKPECCDTLIKDTAKELHDRFGIEHSTIQMEGIALDSGCC
ncbi:MAG: cation transporter [Ignavibacteriales bacterium]|nr:cation transporter [Ignavibacteriales bacterium]